MFNRSVLCANANIQITNCKQVERDKKPYQERARYRGIARRIFLGLMAHRGILVKQVKWEHSWQVVLPIVGYSISVCIDIVGICVEALILILTAHHGDWERDE